MCGNWGVLALSRYVEHARANGEVLPTAVEGLLRRIMLVVQMRGAQAGGLTLIVGGEETIRCRVRALKPKRGDLCTTLFGKVHRQIYIQSLRQSLGLFARVLSGSIKSGTLIVQGHSRFGTSSAPALKETHPHQWSPAVTRNIWAREPKLGWVRRKQTFQVTITHNGDFDAWRPYRETNIDVQSLGHWLARVLQVSNPSQGDSAKAAGILELLLCKGIWFNAVRMSFHLRVACHVQQASDWAVLNESAPKTVPDNTILQAWAQAFDQEFEALVQRMGVETAEPLDESGDLFWGFVDAARCRLKETSSESLKRWIPSSEILAFVTTAVEAFRDNDMFAAMTTFLRRAEGTFGMSVACTVWPRTIVLAAKGQPVSVGFVGREKGQPSLVIWSSEQSALSGLADDCGLQARIDLDDEKGEVIEMVADDAENRLLQTRDKSVFHLTLERGGCAPENGEVLYLRGLHFGNSRNLDENFQPEPLDQSLFRSRLVWLVVNKRPESCTDSGGLLSGSIDLVSPRTPSTSPSPTKTGTSQSAPREVLPVEKAGVTKDVVAQDISHIPALINEIDLSWHDPTSLNSRSADHFVNLLTHSLFTSEHGELRRARTIDVLAFGVESSLWMAQQFVADLSRIFPGLHAVAMSSNVALGLLQEGPGSVEPYNWTYSKENLCIGRTTLGLAVSHSGTTYSTVWAARCLRMRTRHVFAMSSSFDTLMAASVGQVPSAAFTKRLFSSLAGIRPAEASTVATVAIHHTMSHLLLRCAERGAGVRLPSLFKHSRQDIVDGSTPKPIIERETTDQPGPPSTVPRCCAASPEAVSDMQRLVLTLYWGACSSCGVDAHGQRLSKNLSATREELRSAGRVWSHHITEGYWATFVPAAYVLLTVVAGFLPATEACSAVFDALEIEFGEWKYWVFRAIDAGLYIFMPIIVAMVHRMCTGRRLWARFTTRTLVIVESTVNYKLLRAYASKLLALSWRFATLTVMGQNGTDHFVHEFTHKAQSDALIGVGLPDGRLPSSASAESCIQMSVQQAKFIKIIGKGIEIIRLGHNPWARPGLFKRAVTLPTRRPLFATEKLLLHDKLMPNASSNLPSQREGVQPGNVLQRWNDFMNRQMDPLGMPAPQLDVNALQKQIAPMSTVDLDSAVRILEDLLDKQRVEAQAEVVPLGLRRFLSRYLAQPPERKYASPVKIFHQDPPNVEKVKSSTAADLLSISLRIDGPLSAADGSTDTTPSNLEPCEEAIARAKIGKKLDGHQNGPAMLSQISTPDREYMEIHEFMALVHGDELQRWVRGARYRWTRIRKARGYLSLISAEEHAVDVLSTVFVGGLTVSHVFLAWSTLTRKEAATHVMNPNKAASKHSLALDVSLEHAARAKRKSDNGQMTEAVEHLATCDVVPGATGKPIGGDLLESTEDAEVIDALRLTEVFQESRVGSAERLIGWFVLLHAMVEPSSRLPVLSYEMGMTESRLRVASTPAPVPFQGGHGPLNVEQELMSQPPAWIDDGEETIAV